MWPITTEVVFVFQDVISNYDLSFFFFPVLCLRVMYRFAVFVQRRLDYFFYISSVLKTFYCEC